MTTVSTPILLDDPIFKKTWTDSEIEQAKKGIDDYFAQSADWDDAFHEMNLKFGTRDGVAGYFVQGGDYYMDDGIRIKAFTRTAEGRLILVGVQDGDEEKVYYDLED